MMNNLLPILRMLMSLSRSRAGGIGLAIALILVAWTAVEAVMFTGQSIFDDYVAYNRLLVLEDASGHIRETGCSSKQL